MIAFSTVTFFIDANPFFAVRSFPVAFALK